LPVNIIVGILSLLVALVLYSIGAWGAFRAKTVRVIHLGFLWAGFVFDVIATAMMAIQAGGLVPDLHTLLALVGMLACALLGVWAHRAGKAQVGATLSRWVLAPWVVWVFVFVWGMASRGAARMH
jgi:hypothetical protein